MVVSGKRCWRLQAPMFQSLDCLLSAIFPSLKRPRATFSATWMLWVVAAHHFEASWGFEGETECWSPIKRLRANDSAKKLCCWLLCIHQCVLSTMSHRTGRSPWNTTGRLRGHRDLHPLTQMCVAHQSSLAGPDGRGWKPEGPGFPHIIIVRQTKFAKHPPAGHDY